jgi:hypothetical protein
VPVPLPFFFEPEPPTEVVPEPWPEDDECCVVVAGGVLAGAT